jgi:hypothetical protein
MPLTYDPANQAAVLRVGLRTDRAWHFWSPSPRAALPLGRLDGCTVRARVRISAGALLQVGMDYRCSPTIPYGTGGTNHEAGASNWYFPSPDWQEASFIDVGGRSSSQDYVVEAGRLRPLGRAGRPSSITKSLLE